MGEGSTSWSIVFMLGAPGAGKGTQCSKILDHYPGWQHLSTGDLLRAEVAAGSTLGQEAAAIMESGAMVPTSLVLDLLSNAMASSGAKRFLIDGYPRKLDQLQEFEAKIQPADFVIAFTLDEEAAVQRLVKRGETSGRADDNEDTIRSRMQVFAAESQPVIDALKETGRVAEIDSAADVDTVFALVQPVMDALNQKAAAKEAEATAPAQEEALEQVTEDAPAADAEPAGEEAEEGTAAEEAAPDVEPEEKEDQGAAAEEVEAVPEVDAAQLEPTLEVEAEPELEEEAEQPEAEEQPAAEEEEPAAAEEGLAAEGSVAPLHLPEDSKIVFVLGAPGAGKGTQCARIVAEYGWTHLSTGDLLRAEVAAGTELGQEASGIMETGGFVPTSMILNLLVNAMARSGAKRFLVDGFPRKLDQLQEFEAKIRPADFVMVFTLDEEAAVQRLVKRGETSGRADDNEDTIRSRMQVFAAESQPVIDALKETGRVAEIDSDADVDTVYERVQEVITQIEGQTPPVEATTLAAEAEEESQAEETLAAEEEPVQEDAAVPEAELSQAAPEAHEDQADSLEDLPVEEELREVALEQESPPLIADLKTAAPLAADLEPVVEGGEADSQEEEEEEDPADSTLEPDSLQGTAEQPSFSDLREDVLALAAQVTRLLVVSGPSGVGKGTLITRLMKEYPNHFGFSVSHTTRGPRPGEQDGEHYHFVDEDVMKAETAAGAFLEHAGLHGNLYGTSLRAVAAVCSAGKVPVLDIDVQGAGQVRSSVVGDRCVSLFIAPPSLEELESRLRGRGTESEDRIQARLSSAQQEMDAAGSYSATVINGEVEKAYSDLKAAINTHVPGLFTAADLASPLASHSTAATPSVSNSRPASAAETHQKPAFESTSVTAAETAPPTHTLAPKPPTPPMSAGRTPPRSAAPRSPLVASRSVVAQSSIKSLPVRQYMDVTVVPVLREALRALNDARPADPLQFLSDQLLAARAKLPYGSPPGQ